MPLLPGAWLTDPVTGDPLIDPITKLPLIVPPNADVSCACTCGPCPSPPGTPCISVTLAGVTLCPDNIACRTILDDGDGEYIVPRDTGLGGGGIPPGVPVSDSAGVWQACFPTESAGVRCFGTCPHRVEILPGIFIEENTCGTDCPDFADSCDAVYVNVTCYNGLVTVRIVVGFSATVSNGDTCAFGCDAGFEVFNATVPGPITDGMVINNGKWAGNTDCNTPYFADAFGGTVTIHLLDNCDGSTADECPSCSDGCAPYLTNCDTCTKIQPLSDCGALPASVTIDIGAIVTAYGTCVVPALRDFCGGCTDDPCSGTGTVTLNFVGGSCAGGDAAYSASVPSSRGAGLFCWIVTLQRFGGSWLLTVAMGNAWGIAPPDCCPTSPLWYGWLNAGVTGPCGTYTIACDGCICDSICAVCTLTVSCACTCQSSTAPAPPSCDTSYLTTLPSTITSVLSGMTVCFGLDCNTTLNGTHTLTYSDPAPALAFDRGPGWYYLADVDPTCCSGSSPCKAQISIWCAGIDGTTGLPTWRASIINPAPGATVELVMQYIGATPFASSADWINETGIHQCWWADDVALDTSGGISCGCDPGSLANTYTVDTSHLTDSTSGSFPSTVTVTQASDGCAGAWTATITTDGGDQVKFKLWLDVANSRWVLLIDDTAPSVGDPGVLWEGSIPCDVDPAGDYVRFCDACLYTNCDICSVNVS